MCSSTRVLTCALRVQKLWEAETVVTEGCEPLCPRWELNVGLLWLNC